MNRIERRVRNMINPYSTAFARWWCHSGRYLRLVRMITGDKAAGPPRRRRPAKPSVISDAPEALGLRSPPSSAARMAVMETRRAAIDALLAATMEGEEDTGQGRP
jgi:hypothetical protein